jgi:hypothetical protein
MPKTMGWFYVGNDPAILAAQREGWRKREAFLRTPFPNDCDVIRARISRYLATSGSTQKAFLCAAGEAIGKATVNGNTLNKFMQRKGPHEGEDLEIYRAAKLVFEAMDAKAGTTPTAASASSSASPDVAAPLVAAAALPAQPKAPSKAEAAAAFASLTAALDAIELPEDDNGETIWSGAQPSCNAIRRKINEYLAANHVTQTAFLAHIHVNSNSFGRFMSFTGAFQGIDNGTYWRARMFFERLAIHNKNTAKGAKGVKRGASDDDGAAAASLPTPKKAKSASM